MSTEQLVQAGSVIIALALIGILSFVLKMLFKVITNHLHDQKQSTDDLRIVITELVNYLKKANGKR